MADAIFLCYGDPSECQNCGGWVGCAGIPDGIEPDFGGRYCSGECVDDAMEFREKVATRLAASREE